MNHIKIRKKNLSDEEEEFVLLLEIHYHNIYRNPAYHKNRAKTKTSHKEITMTPRRILHETQYEGRLSFA